MPISFRLEHVIEEVLSRHPGDQKRALRRAAGVKLSEREAQIAWPRVLEHKWFLSERLGRDVGLRVAAVDYFENVQRPRSSKPSKGEGEMFAPRLPMMQSLAERMSL
ncbi:MAG TPA: DUF4032 domain-containing protein [Pyrinomonadaceae bacterium]|jgi:hypothetical protein